MINVLKIVPSDLANYTMDELWAIPHHTPVEVLFDDDIVKTGSLISLAISSYYWRIALHFDMPVTSDLWIGDNAFTDNKHLNLLWAAIEPTSHDEVKYNKEYIWTFAYEHIYNALYVAIGKHLTIYMSGVGMDEINQYLQDDEIMSAVNSINVLNDVPEAHARIVSVLRNKHKDTAFHQEVMNGTVPEAQVTQSFSRGITTDNDSSIFLQATKRGFAMGIREMAAVAKESCSAAKAILAQKDPVRKASTQDRRMQLICGVIQTLVPGDCCTADGNKINIPSDEKGISDMDISLRGMYQMIDIDDTSALRVIKKGYVGTIIKPGSVITIRTALGCKHIHKQAICEICTGRLAYSLPYGTNPGFISAVAIMTLIVQLLISTKHYDFVTYMFRAALKGREREFLRVDKERATDIYIKDEVIDAVAKAKEELWLSIPSKSAPGISIVNTLRNVDIPIASISKLENEFSLFTMTGFLNHKLIETFSLKCRSNVPSLSREMLRYLKGDNWSISKDGKAIHINLGNWDIRNPIISYPLKHESMMEFSNSVNKFLTATDDTYGKPSAGEPAKDTMSSTICSYTSTSEALNDTWALLNTNLKGLYMGHLAIILAASRITSSEENDYRLPKSMYEGEFAPYPVLFKERSLSGALLNGYIEQHSIGNINSYTRQDRMPLFTDDFIMIEEDRYDWDWEKQEV